MRPCDSHCPDWCYWHTYRFLLSLLHNTQLKEKSLSIKKEPCWEFSSPLCLNHIFITRTCISFCNNSYLNKTPQCTMGHYCHTHTHTHTHTERHTSFNNHGFLMIKPRRYNLCRAQLIPRSSFTLIYWMGSRNKCASDLNKRPPGIGYIIDPRHMQWFLQ